MKLLSILCAGDQFFMSLWSERTESSAKSVYQWKEQMNTSLNTMVSYITSSQRFENIFKFDVDYILCAVPSFSGDYGQSGHYLPQTVSINGRTKGISKEYFTENYGVIY